MMPILEMPLQRTRGRNNSKKYHLYADKDGIHMQYWQISSQSTMVV